MSKALITESLLTDIADAIRAKLGYSVQMRPGDMPAAIAQIHGEPRLESILIQNNGEYSPSSGYDGFDFVTVSVSGGGDSHWVAPDYQGLSYSYVAINGKYYQNNTGKTHYMSFFTVESGKTYALFVGSTVSNRLRAHFYAGKSFSDFEQYVENSGEKTEIYTCTTNISGSTELTGDRLMERLVFTAGGNGELVVQTSNQSDTAPAYCVELP